MLMYTQHDNTAKTTQAEITSHTPEEAQAKSKPQTIGARQKATSDRVRLRSAVFGPANPRNAHRKVEGGRASVELKAAVRVLCRCQAKV